VGTGRARLTVRKTFRWIMAGGTTHGLIAGELWIEKQAAAELDFEDAGRVIRGSSQLRRGSQSDWQFTQRVEHALGIGALAKCREMQQTSQHNSDPGVMGDLQFGGLSVKLFAKVLFNGLQSS